ncbi:MAG: LysR substrate-binding domain-containing protein [Xenococcaceae cyanobacterium MO_188.B32]|nr:LysR substrate-binding domain-containing protein [Xenococcaceae cyanobacterium MO_188.B32]
MFLTKVRSLLPNKNIIQTTWRTPQPTIIGLVAAGIGVSFVSSSLQSINRPGVVYRELDVPTPELELVAAWKIEKVSPVLRKFLTVVTACLTSI